MNEPTAAAQGKSAVTVKAKWWSDGKRNPPDVELVLSNGTAVIVGFDFYGLRKFVFLHTTVDDCRGVEVPQWMTGIDGDEMDEVIAEVQRRRDEWFADRDSADFFAGVAS